MTAAKRQKERASIPIKSERKQYIKATWANKRVIERGTTCKKKKKERETAVKQKRRKNRIPGRRALVIPSGGDVRFL